MVDSENRISINLVSGELNENDNNLIFICSESEKSVGEISRELDIAQKNVISKLTKLEAKKLIKINRQGRGKKTLVTSNKNNALVKEIIMNKQLENSINNSANPKKMISEFLNS
jgi:predicted ArsR family transcriptional regulator